MKNSEGRFQELKSLIKRRIVVLDGAMGTMIQQHKLEESDFRGTQFANHPCDVKGNNDLLAITQPDLIASIHQQYIEAGADIIETNTFNSNAISMADYEMGYLAYELNVAGAEAARKAVEIVMSKDSSRGRLVAGAIGPTNRTACMSPDVNNPAFRAVNFEQLRKAYYEQVRGLVDGGVETVEKQIHIFNPNPIVGIKTSELRSAQDGTYLCRTHVISWKSEDKVGVEIRVFPPIRTLYLFR